MKRFIMVILAVLAFCTLVACGADNAEDDKASDSDSDITASADGEELPPNDDSAVTSVSEVYEEPTVTSTPESEPAATDESVTSGEPETEVVTTTTEETAVTTTTEATTIATTTATTTTTTTTTARTESTSISVDDEFADFPIVDAEDEDESDNDSEDIIWENANIDEILAELEDEDINING